MAGETGSDPGCEPAADATFRLLGRALETGFLTLPWGDPLSGWTCSNLVDLERGIGRHVVRFVEIGGSYYALKELPAPIARREYRLLVHLQGTNVPAVEPVGVIAERRTAAGELDEVLITRYLEYSLPFRTVLGRRVLDAPEPVLAEALAGLLVRLHLAGFFWGDCSFSNALFRRDAGTLAAYLVDLETGEPADGVRSCNATFALRKCAWSDDVRKCKTLTPSSLRTYVHLMDEGLGSADFLDAVERLGHASVSITLDVYSHAVPALEESAAALVASLVD